MAYSQLVGGGNLTLLRMIQKIGATANLGLCLDAGDALSYDGASQTWADRSGGSQNFYRGSTSGGEATDPTFNGTAGKKSANEFFALTTAQFFVETSTALNFAESYHKDGATLTMLAVIRPGFSGAGLQLAAMFRNVSGITQGIQFLFIRNTGQDFIQLNVTNGAGSALSKRISGSPLVNGAWNFVAVSLSENTGAGGGFFQVNATQEAFDPTYTSPSGSDSSVVYSLGNTVAFDYACLAAASRKWSTTETSALYAQLKRRFTSLP